MAESRHGYEFSRKGLSAWERWAAAARSWHRAPGAACAIRRLDIHSYVDVIPLLADAGLRVIVPYLRGHGPTRFVERSTPRSGQQAALGADVIALMDALGISRAILAGYDWGGRAACIAAALWPERCAGLVSVTSYLIQDISTAMNPIRPDPEAGFWYIFYFATERGRRGLIANRRDIARVIWTRNSPNWHFDEATLDRAAHAFDNDDYVDIVIHSYRHRLGLAPGYAPYDEIEKRLAGQPPITVPSITLDGQQTGTSLPPTGPHRRRTSPALAPTVKSQTPDTTSPKKAPKPSLKQSLTWFVVP